MKNTKYDCRKNQDLSIQKRRASGLRALSGSALKAVKGGQGPGAAAPPGIDPIC
ncbi:MAG TPA: hypothetical protein VGD37_18835 [Kofleriaceae bacterium]